MTTTTTSMTMAVKDMLLCAFLFGVFWHPAIAAPSPHLIMVVADDLGYNDLGIRNGNKTLTPAIDSLGLDGSDRCPAYRRRWETVTPSFGRRR